MHVSVGEDTGQHRKRSDRHGRAHEQRGREDVMHVMTAGQPRTEPDPSDNGRMIELTDTLAATRSRPRIRRRSSRYPTANMNITTPRLASALNGGLSVTGTVSP